jgi:hypothetical protein
MEKLILYFPVIDHPYMNYMAEIKTLLEHRQESAKRRAILLLHTRREILMKLFDSFGTSLLPFPSRICD